MDNALASSNKLPLFKVSTQSMVLTPEEALWTEGADLFSKQAALILTQIIAPSTLLKISHLLSHDLFISRELEYIGTQEVEKEPTVGRMINFLLARPELFHRLEQITGCGTLRRVAGGIARLQAGSEHKLQWHDDINDEHRRLAITINLSIHRYDGGQFELRKKGCASPLFSYQHHVVGDAILFKVDRALEHRVTPVSSGGPRIVFAGWFLSH